MLVDGHVHLHPSFSLSRVCERGLSIAKTAGCPVLLWVVDAVDQLGFARVRRELSSLPFSNHDTGESTSVGVVRDGARLFFVSGNQLVTREGIELLSLGDLPRKVSALDGRCNLEQLGSELLDAGGPVVLPWGFGKWVGRRGIRLREFLAKTQGAEQSRLFLGDIRARCWPWPRPDRWAPELTVLPGSDPLPLRGYEGEILRFAFSISTTDVSEAPTASLVRSLLAGAEVEAIGTPATPWSALYGQWAYRRRSRR